MSGTPVADEGASLVVDLVAHPVFHLRVREPGQPTVRLEEWLARHTTGAAWDGLEHVWRVRLELGA